MLYRGNMGFALLFGGIEAVPLVTVTNFPIGVRRYERRTAAPKT